MRRTILVTVFALISNASAFADYPVSSHSASLKPPTPMDYYRYEQRQIMKSMGFACGMGVAAYVPPTITYYEPTPCTTCGETSHRSFRGAYGPTHPQPYYIANPPPPVTMPGRPPRGGILFTPATSTVLSNPPAMEVVPPGTR